MLLTSAQPQARGFYRSLTRTLRYSNACFSCAFAFHSWQVRRAAQPTSEGARLSTFIHFTYLLLSSAQPHQARGFYRSLTRTLRYRNACFSCAFAFHSWSERRTTGLAVSQLGGASSTQAPERAPQTQRASPAGAPQRGAAPLSTDLAVTQGIGASSARARTTRQTAPGRPINPMLQSPAELLRSRHQSADTRRDHESVNEAQIRGETVNQ